MTYEYSYSLGSIVFLGITMFFYFSKARIHNFEDKFFSYLLVGSMIALLFDLFASLADQYSGILPTWMLYFLNIVAISSLHFCQPCFCLFLYKVPDREKFIKPLAYFVTFLPFLILCVLLFVSTISHNGLFFIDEFGKYQRGTTYNVLFFTSAIYYVTSLVLVIIYYRDMERSRNRLILLCFGLFLTAALLQYFFQRYLMNTTATALTVAILHLTLQNPVDRIDPFTGCFSRIQLSKLLQRYHEKQVPYTLLLFSVGYSGEQHVFGISESTAQLLRQVSDFLRSTFSGDAVVYMDTTEFTVVCQRSVDPQELRRARESFAREFGSSMHTAPPELNVGVLHSEEKSAEDSILLTLDYLFKRLHSEKQRGILVADAAFRRECYEDTALALNIDTLLTEEHSRLMLSEMYNSTGIIAGYRAFLVVNAEGVGDIFGERLAQKADESGLGWKYFSLLIGKLAARQERLAGGRFAEISIPTSICLTGDAAERIDALVKAAGIKPEQIVLSMKEKSVVNSQSTVRENIRHAAQLGYNLRVTDFASGVTNVALFISMPVGEIELTVNNSSADLIGGDPNKMLKAVIGLLKGLNKQVICSGVTNIHQAEILFGYGADLIEYRA